MIPTRSEPPTVGQRIWADRRTAGIILLVFLVLSPIYTFIVAPVWEAKCTIVFPNRPPTLLAAPGAFGQEMNSATAILSGNTPLKFFVGILNSDTVLESAHRKTGLKRRSIMAMREFTYDTSADSLTIAVRNRNASLAKQFVSIYLSELSAIDTRLNGSFTKGDVSVLNKHISLLQSRVRREEKKYERFVTTARTAPTVMTASGPGGVEALLPSASSWNLQYLNLKLDYNRVLAGLAVIDQKLVTLKSSKGKLPSDVPGVEPLREELASEEYDLRVRLLTLAPTSPDVIKTKKSIDITRSRLKSELAKYLESAHIGLVDPEKGGGSLAGLLLQKATIEAQMMAVRRLANESPKESIQLLRLLNQMSSDELSINQLKVRRQVDSVQMDRDQNRWKVLDPPHVESRPINKSYLKNGVIFGALGMILGCCVAAFRGSKRLSSGA